jgi:hypothetical protein
MTYNIKLPKRIVSVPPIPIPLLPILIPESLAVIIITVGLAVYIGVIHLKLKGN